MSVVNGKNAYRVLGFMLTAMGISMIPALIASIYFHESKQIVPFLLTITATILIGNIIVVAIPASEKKAKARDGFFIVSLAWILASLIGAVPAFASGAIPSFIDSFFETCSGFTTTGASLIENIEIMPKSILLWRSCAVWLGGAGIILFTAFVLPFSSIRGHKLARHQLSLQHIGKFHLKFHGTVSKLFRLYVFLTLSLIIFFYLGKMSLFDSILHGLSTIGTGGFSTYNNGLAHFGNPFINWVCIIFMFIAGSNLNLWLGLEKYGIKTFRKNAEFKFYLILIVSASTLISTNTYFSGIFTTPCEAITSGFFQVTSFISTSGQRLSNFNAWPTFSKMILLAIMLIGGCTSSLAGGPKVLRILTSIRLIQRGISIKLHPNKIFVISIDKKELPQEVSTNIANFMFLYFFTIFSGCLLVSINDFDLITTFSGVLACLNNIGLGFNLVGPTGGFHIFSGFSKLILSLLMIAGRLELFTLLMLFSPHYWNPDRV